MPTILLKKSDTASAVPTTANLTNLAGGVEVAVNTADKRMFTMTSASAVVELGTNPSSLTLTGGTANGVLYLNGSKAVTSGSALSFTGSLLKVGNPTNAPNTNLSGNLLQVKSASGFSYLTMGNGDGADNNTYIGSASSITTFGTVTDAGATSELMRLTSTGLGIGTSSPSTKLHIKDSTGTAVNLLRLETPYSNPSGNKSIIWTDATDALGRISISYTAAGGSQMSFGSLYNGGYQTSDLMVLNSSGNLGLGVTPSAWNTSFKALQVSNSVLYNNGAADTFLGANFYNDTSGTNRYITSAQAAAYGQVDGAHQWYTAPSGTAGNAISFTQAMTLDASGNLGLDVTPSAWAFRRAMQIGAAASIASQGGSNSSLAEFSANSYINSGGNATYIGSNYATQYSQYNGAHAWYTAPSGTAGNAISFTQAMTLTSANNLLVGTTTDVSGRSGVISDVSGNVRAIPRTGAEKTSDYTLAITDVGQFVQVGTSGSVTVPNNTFATGDVVSVFNNTTGNISLNCPITTAYVGGTNTDRASVTLSTRGVATVLFINPSLCVINGNVS